MKHFSSLLASIECDVTFRKKPSPLPVDEITEFKVPKALAKYVILADEEFNIGSAWWCQDTVSGAIYRVSPEFEPLVMFLNSDLKSFEATLQAVAKWSTEHDSNAIRQNPKLIDELSATLKKLDPQAFKSKKNYWPLMIDHMRSFAEDDDDELEFWFKLK